MSNISHLFEDLRLAEMAEMQTVIPWGGYRENCKGFLSPGKKVNCVRIKWVSVKLGLKRHNIFEVEEEFAVLFSSKPVLPVWTVVILD